MRGILSFVAVSVIFDIFSGVLHAQKLDKGVGPVRRILETYPNAKILGTGLFLFATRRAKRGF